MTAHLVNLDRRDIPPAGSGRILLVAEAFGGGLFEITRIMAEGLARRGYTVAIAFGRRPETPEDVRGRVDEQVEVIPLPWTARSFAVQARGHLALRRLIARWRPDVIHLMSSFSGLHGVLLGSDVPTVYTPQAYSFTMDSERRLVRWAYLMLESFVAGRVNVVGACSLSEGEQARSLPNRDCIAVVPNGIDELNHGRGVVRDDEERTARRVVAIGRPLPQRRPEACARILLGVSDLADVQWLGGGRDGSAGTRALLNAGIAMTGWQPRDETMQTLATSAVYLHWTAWDGLPLSLLEALALDVVVVASDIGPNREVLGPDQVCRTEEQAIALIRRLLCDPDLRQRFLVSQRLRRKLYGADRMVDGWSDLYETLMAPAAAWKQRSTAVSVCAGGSPRP